MKKIIILCIAFILILYSELSYAEDIPIHGRGLRSERLYKENQRGLKRDTEKDSSWTNMDLVDEQDQPISPAGYKNKLPEGSTIDRGRLDSEGIAHESGIEPGTCTASFPDADKEEWERE